MMLLNLKVSMRKLIRFLSDISIIKTVYFNFHYFDLKTAIIFPVFIGKNTILRKLAGKVLVPSTCKTGRIRIGFESIGIFDKRNSKGIWEVCGEVEFKGSAFLGQGTKLFVDNQGKIIFGDRFSLTGESQLISQRKISFGDDCLVSWDCLLLDTDFHKIYNKNNQYLNPPKEIIIGNKVWIGCRTTILKGSRVSNHSILGAGSLLSKELSEENSIFSGNPVVKLKSNIYWHL